MLETILTTPLTPNLSLSSIHSTYIFFFIQYFRLFITYPPLVVGRLPDGKKSPQPQTLRNSKGLVIIMNLNTENNSRLMPPDQMHSLIYCTQGSMTWVRLVTKKLQSLKWIMDGLTLSFTVQYLKLVLTNLVPFVSCKICAEQQELPLVWKYSNPCNCYFKQFSQSRKGLSKIW